MTKFLVLLTVALFSATSNADYFKGGLGYTIGGDVKITGPVSSNPDLDNSFIFPIVAAYGFEIYDQFSLEIEGSFRKNEYDGVTNSIEPKVFALAVNAAGSLPITSGVSLAGGLGVTYGGYGDLIAGGDTENALGVQVFGGADFKVQENISLGGEVRHFTTMTDIDLGSGLDAEYTNTALLFTFKYSM